VRELRLAEQAHRELPSRVEEAYRAAHRLACHEWSVRQFIGGPAEPSPRIADAIAGGRELLEVRCQRCSHESLIDLTEVVWPREKPVHTPRCCDAKPARTSGKSRSRTWWRCGHDIQRAIRQWRNGAPVAEPKEAQPRLALLGGDLGRAPCRATDQRG
jgi:hypothetical protein